MLWLGGCTEAATGGMTAGAFPGMARLVFWLPYVACGVVVGVVSSL